MKSLAEVLEGKRQIKITVIGRRSGRPRTLPVWFVLAQRSLWLLPVTGSKTQWYRNLRVNPVIVLRAENDKWKLRARQVSHPATVRKVIAWFGKKYKRGVVAKLYSVFDAAVEAKPAR